MSDTKYNNKLESNVESKNQSNDNLESNFEMKLTLDENHLSNNQDKNIESINLTNLSKDEIFILYSEDKIVLSDIIREFESRNLDLWKEYKIYQDRIITR